VAFSKRYKPIDNQRMLGLDRTFGCGSLRLRETGHPYSITGVTSCITGALPFNVTFNPVQYRERIRNRESGC